MDEFITSFLHGVAAQGPYVSLFIIAIWYLHDRLNKSEAAREELNEKLVGISAANAAAAMETAKAQLAIQASVERLNDRLSYTRTRDHRNG